MKLFVLLSLAAIAAAATPIDPQFDAARDTRFILYTRLNRVNGQELINGDLNSVLNSNYNPAWPVRVVTHGWGGDETTTFIEGATHALLNHDNYNIIAIDWGAGAQTINYPAAVLRVQPVGAFAATFLDFLQSTGQLTYARTKILGFSLGAHVCGHIGKNVRNGRVSAIIGLDPAGPLFSVSNPTNRLDAGDAEYVECIHTNGPTLLVAGAGIGAPIGHADFFPNGGRSQPGCILNSCSHDRAVDFYLEAIVRNGFHATRCPNADAAGSGNCPGSPELWISSEPTNAALAPRGIFWFSTNNASPFAQGQVRP